MENNNKIDFDENKPYLAPHNPFTLEGHWQPWYDDRRDYGTNAPTYFDYLSNNAYLNKQAIDLINEVESRDIETNSTKSVKMQRFGNWHGVDKHITLQSDVILSKAQDNYLSIKDDGLHVHNPIDIIENKETALNNRINETNSNVETLNDNLTTEINTRTNQYNDIRGSVLDTNNAVLSVLKPVNHYIDFDIVDNKLTQNGSDTLLKGIHYNSIELNSSVTSTHVIYQFKVVINNYNFNNVSNDDVILRISKARLREAGMSENMINAFATESFTQSFGYTISGNNVRYGFYVNGDNIDIKVIHLASGITQPYSGPVREDTQAHYITYRYVLQHDPDGEEPDEALNELTDIRDLGDGHVFTLAGDATRYIYSQTQAQPEPIMNIIYKVHEHSYFDNRKVGDTPKLKQNNEYTAYIVPVKPNTTISTNKFIGDVFSQYLDANLKVVSNIKNYYVSAGVYNVPANAMWAYITVNSPKPDLVVVNHPSIGKTLTYSELPPQEVYGYVFNNTVIPKIKFDELITGEKTNIELHVGSGQPYPTIQQALNAVNNSSKNKVYDIVCHPGNHYFSMINNKLPDYVNIKGSSANYNDVVIIGELADNADDYTISHTATFNVSKNNNFENVTITGKNMRYTIHDESSGKDKNWTRIVKNCRIVHYGNKGAVDYRTSKGESTAGIWTVTRAWGEGASSGAKSYFDNVIFESPVQPYYCHEPNDENSPQPYFKQFNNCVFKTTKDEYAGFGGGVTIDNNNQRCVSKNVIIFNNCSFERGKIQINGDVPIDVRIHGSNSTPIQVSNLINYPKTDNTMLFYYAGEEPLTGFEKLTINLVKGYEYVVKATASTPSNEIVGINVTGAVSKGQTVMTSSDKFIFNKNQLIIN